MGKPNTAFFIKFFQRWSIFKVSSFKKAENKTERKIPIKFLGVTLDENISWGELFAESKLSWGKILDYCTT